MNELNLLGLMYDPDPSEGGDPKPANDPKPADDSKPEPSVDPDPEDEYDFDGHKVKLKKSQATQYLKQGSGALQILKNLQEQGVIDENGNPVTKEIEKEEEKDPTEELNERLTKLETEKSVSEIKKEMNNTLDFVIKNHEFSKDEANAEDIDDARQLATAKYILDNKKNIGTLMKEILDKKLAASKKKEEYWKNKIKDGKIVGDGPGGGGTFSLEKPFTKKDWNERGKLSKALKEMLESGGSVG